MYSYIKDNNENSKIAKRIKKIVIKKDTKHEDYRNTLFNGEQMIDFFKVMINSVFGKTIENIRKRVDARLVTDKMNY